MTESTSIEDYLLFLIHPNILSSFYGKRLFVFQQNRSQVRSDNTGSNLMHYMMISLTFGRVLKFMVDILDLLQDNLGVFSKLGLDLRHLVLKQEVMGLKVA